MLCRKLLNFAPIVRSATRTISMGPILRKTEDRHSMMRSMPKKDDGSSGERARDLDVTGYRKVVDFPDANTDERLFNNVPFKEVAIVHIRATPNNTHFLLTNAEGRPLYHRSCGNDGFKNCRKGTSVAAQSTGASFGKVITNRGYKMARVCVNGLGPGRMSAFKGLEQAGIEVISITDSTPIYQYPRQRPPCRRRI